uniref:FAD-binding oxidoreductase n=1 Tax=candidate division WOR-3 bacterium TaxID=2052148 RepID=A0A7C3UP00_UNCW3
MKNPDCLIIGGGVIGASVGYYLAKEKMKVYLLEKNYPTAGSTGKAIGGIRQQFSHHLTIQIMIESVKIFSSLSEELGIDIEWYPGGYLFLAHSPEMKENYLKAIAIQKGFNLPVRFLSPQECQEIVPFLNPENLLGGAYCPTDGHANPFKVTYGYLEGLKRKGGKVFLRTEVTEIKREGKNFLVRTRKGEKFSAPIVVNCAGPWAGEVGKLLNLNIPIYPERHEGLVTEETPHLFDPMIVDYRPDGCYFFQFHSTRHIIGCYTPIPPVYGPDISSTFLFLTEMPRRMQRLIPQLKEVKILRQWAGSYEMTPDGNPIVSGTEIEGFYVVAGMCGHGFMLAPGIGKLFSEMITRGKSSIPLDEFRLNRDFGKREVMR